MAYSDNFLQQLYEASPDIIYSVAVADGSITSISPAFTDLTGWQVKDWIGRPFSDLIHPDDASRAFESFQRRIQGQSKQDSLTIRIITSTGERIVEASSSILSNNGRPTELVGIARDITDRQNVEDELERRSRQVLHILESITDGFYLLDNDWRYVMLNQTAEDVAQTPRSKLLGQVFWDVRSPKTVAALRVQFEHAKATGKVVVFEESDEDRQTWYEIRAYPHDDGLAVYFTDISIRKRAEEELKKHNQGVEKILADILGIQEKWS